MSRFLLAVIFFAFCSQALYAAGRPRLTIESGGPGGVLQQLTLANLGGAGQTTIQALQRDAAGNIYVAGTTGSLNFPVKHAARRNSPMPAS